MPVVAKKNTLAGLSVGEALRKQVIRLHREQSLAQAILLMGKHKVNTVLVTDDNTFPAGVISKTDIMGAYYASLPVDSPLEFIMSSPPVFCNVDDLLETALDSMRSNKVHCLYVSGQTGEEASGILTYSDIVGLLYQYCHTCKLSKSNAGRKKTTSASVQRFKAKDAMSTQVVSFNDTDALSMIMEGLSAYRFGAVLITDSNNHPCGMISKTDLVFAFSNGVSPDAPATAIMSTEVIACEEDEYLERAIQKMILAEVQRIFVYKGNLETITGVLSLSDTARLKSGSCHACTTSRIRVGKHN